MRTARAITVRSALSRRSFLLLIAFLAVCSSLLLTIKPAVASPTIPNPPSPTSVYLNAVAVHLAGPDYVYVDPFADIPLTSVEQQTLTAQLEEFDNSGDHNGVYVMLAQLDPQYSGTSKAGIVADLDVALANQMSSDDRYILGVTTGEGLYVVTHGINDADIDDQVMYITRGVNQTHAMDKSYLPMLTAWTNGLESITYPPAPATVADPTDEPQPSYTPLSSDITAPVIFALISGMFLGGGFLAIGIWLGSKLHHPFGNRTNSNSYTGGLPADANNQMLGAHPAPASSTDKSNQDFTAEAYAQQGDHARYSQFSNPGPSEIDSRTSQVHTLDSRGSRTAFNGFRPE